MSKTLTKIASDDSYLLNGESDVTNHGADAFIQSTLNTTNTKGFIKFDLSSIPIGSHIISATISLTVSAYAVPFPNTANQLLARLTSDWSELALVGSNMPVLVQPLYGNLNPTAVDTQLNFDVKSLVQVWASGAIGNYGVAVFGGGAPGDSIQFYSKDAAVADIKKPTITVVYEDGFVSDTNPTDDTYYSNVGGPDTVVHGAEVELQTSNGTTPTEAFLKFAIPSIPTGAVINSASLVMTGSYANVAGHPHLTVKLFKLTGNNWDEDTFTGLIQPAHDDGSFLGSSEPLAVGKQILFDVKALFESWRDGSYPNRGLAVTQEFPYSGVDVRFHSKEAPVAASMKPRLVVTYTYTPPPTIRELILQNLETALAGITKAAGYTVDVATVERSRTAAYKTASMPSIFIYEETDNPLNDNFADIVERLMTVRIVFWIRSHDNLSQVINAYYGDVLRAVMADRQRGNHALDTLYLDGDFQVGDEAGPLGNGEIIFAVKYRHLANDPTAEA